jgi:hypothetical protein
MFAALYFIEDVTEKNRKELMAMPKDREVEESEKEDEKNVSVVLWIVRAVLWIVRAVLWIAKKR